MSQDLTEELKAEVNQLDGAAQAEFVGRLKAEKQRDTFRQALEAEHVYRCGCERPGDIDCCEAGENFYVLKFAADQEEAK